jgi:hypothetical protein
MCLKRERTIMVAHIHISINDCYLTAMKMDSNINLMIYIFLITIKRRDKKKNLNRFLSQ